jgi:carboxyl-terminal processing protease
VNKLKIWLPFLFSALLAIGIYIGMRMNEPYRNINSFFSFRTGQFNKINDVINYINQEYVDTVNQKVLVESTIQDLLHQLDPHSAYIPASDLQASNEPLEGNFDGIGVEFHIQNDTIMVVSAISGGPSDALGIQAGDRIITVDGKNVASIHITSAQVMQSLRGPGGTKVKVTIFRSGRTIDYEITRGKIPINTVDVSYMLNSETGYIKVSHFGERTYEEYIEGFMKLKEAGMKKLVLDLRGNPGGYLKTAIQLTDEYLPEKKLIVYTQGRSRPKESFYSTSRGFFENGQLVVLIDEGSASASEIVSGALQDWDRAVIIGRRSFGKGLVQEQSEFPDGSAIRLTIARYFTPTGRCIQKPYDNNYEHYDNELLSRYQKGELLSADSIHFPDSLKYETPNGKIVYGGGGIMPDVFVSLDTSGGSNYYSSLSSKGIISEFAYNYLDNNRESFKKYASFNDFNRDFSVTGKIINDFIAFAEEKGVKKDEKGFKTSSLIISTQLKALIARQVWKNDGFYAVIHTLDQTLKKAIESTNETVVSMKMK